MKKNRVLIGITIAAAAICIAALAAPGRPRKDGVRIALFANSSVFNTSDFDFLIIPAGMQFSQKAEASLKEFVFQGGGLLAAADQPLKDIDDVLGIKRYGLPGIRGSGLAVVCGLGASPVQPSRGNVFPYRIPVRDFYSLESLGRADSAMAGIAVKSWRNPYPAGAGVIPHKWCFVKAQEKDSREMAQIIRYMAFPVIIHDLKTDLAAYYSHEQVRVSLAAVNSGQGEARAAIRIEFIDGRGVIAASMRKSVALSAGQEKTVDFTWRPGTLGGNFYTIKASLIEKDTVYDTEENGFVVINKGVLQKGPVLEARGRSFFVDGKKALLVGVNYYESKSGELMWVRPNLYRVRNDFKAMRKMGMNYVRIHYHHSKWFRDYYSQVLKMRLDPYLEAADTTALPSERSLRILDAVIQLAQEEGLVVSFDLFSLVPKEMGDPIGWLTLKERMIDKDKVAVQKKFAAIIARRYKDVPGITWDLWNEPRLAKEDAGLLKAWAGELIKTFRENGDRHLATIGDDMSLELLDVLDYGCIHTYEPAEFKDLSSYPKPVIFQEVWIPAGTSQQEETRQAQELENDFNAFLSSGAAGFAPWQWTRQARLWDNASEAEKWDDDLGLCVREDGSLKPAGRAYIQLINNEKNK